MNQRRKKNSEVKPNKKGIEGASFPEHFKKTGCLYVNGVISHACRGNYIVTLENGMEGVMTSRKLEGLKVSLLTGDAVVCEIPTAGFEPNAKRLRGRVVWRIRNTK